ncbi:MAG: cytochrome b/b6 domain-containing protein [Candidatus Latescibacterota bacterium]|jgi:cytochrome b
MRRILVWDLPVRVFHWVFAACLLSALGIALLAEEESSIFSLHMLAGLSAAFMLILRVIISTIGGAHSRLSDLFFRPGETVDYLVGALKGSSQRYPGHNPGTALVAIGMFLLVLLLVWTGLSRSTESMEEVHPVLAYLLLGLVGAHLIGLLLHTIHHRENIWLSMLTGTKEGPEGAGLAHAHVPAGVATVLLTAGWFIGLWSSFDSASSRLHLPFTGQTITLGESESDKGTHAGEEQEGEEND